VPGGGDAQLRERLLAAFRYTHTESERVPQSDASAWWREPGLLGEIAEGLAGLHGDVPPPTAVVGVESLGFLLGGVVAARLGVGFAEVRKNQHPRYAGERLLRETTPPDYAQRGLTLTMRPHLLRPRDRVLMVDDWIDTGAQADAVRRIVERAEADWLGVAVIVDALPGPTRAALGVRGLLRERELGW
jgi:adenine phosphoribosyltransferase